MKATLAYLNQRGYQMASFDRLRGKPDPGPTDEEFRKLIGNNRRFVREAKLKGGKPGVAKLVP